MVADPIEKLLVCLYEFRRPRTGRSAHCHQQNMQREPHRRAGKPLARAALSVNTRSRQVRTAVSWPSAVSESPEQRAPVALRAMPALN